jgi:phosphoglycerate dehydrogenase-like enzyme
MAAVAAGRRLYRYEDVSMGEAVRIAILDDYLGVARRLAPWESLDDVVEIEVFRQHIADESELVRALERFSVVCLMRERTSFPASVIERLPSLRLVVTSGPVNASIDVAAAAARGVAVCGTASQSHPTVELTIGLMIALARRIPQQDASIRAGCWQVALGVGLNGKRLGVLGLGRNGSQVARLAQALGMDVVAWSANLTAERAAEVGVRLVSKEELLRTSDVVTIHLRLSDRTRGLLGADEFALMRPTALLVNTSRGPIVDERALVEALRSGRIGGAALDVYDEEPVPEGHPLAGLDNVVLTPHLGYCTEENLALFYREMVEDIAAFQRGEPIRVLRPSA